MQAQIWSPVFRSLDYFVPVYGVKGSGDQADV